MHFVDKMNPILMRVGPLQVHWYGAMYALSFAIGYYLLGYLAPKRDLALNGDEITRLVLYLAVGVIFGGRLGYVLFYNLPYYLSHLAQIPAIWDGGMSFHGGLIGVTLAVLIFSWKTQIGFWCVADLIVPVVPLGLFFGRLGNFINGELWGRPSGVPWAVIFPRAPLIHGVMVPRHPSQLYEAGLEGLVLFAIMWTLAQRRRPEGMLFGLFLILYGIFRFCLEFFREPDAQLGLFWGVISMGQILSLPMVLAGVGVFIYARSRRTIIPATADKAVQL